MKASLIVDLAGCFEGGLIWATDDVPPTKKSKEKFELIKFYDIECLSNNASFKRSIKEREKESINVIWAWNWERDKANEWKSIKKHND